MYTPVSNISFVRDTPAASRYTFFDFPREIRDDIYLAVLETPSEPPESPEHADSRFVGFGSEPKQQKHVFYPEDVYPKYACQSLQACNHQLNNEVREVLARYDTLERGLDSKLDLMIQDCDIWPTWTLLPGPITHVRNLEVEVRMFDGCHSSQFGGDGDPGEIFRPLFHLLSGFFHHGPQFIYKGPFEPQLHVDTMVFTISWGEMLKEQPYYDGIGVRSIPCVLSIRHRIVKSVWLKLCKISSRGTLFGRVAKLELKTDEEVKEFPIPDRELAPETVDHWYQYGYRWGIEIPSNEDILGFQENRYPSQQI